ncbi:hypothetical protein L226DRAFT_530174 [Lentinus tigrinus ALCF2SS1-7]|uniref:Uncharacterized protein n=1 Tax=Lentinus tigrinus ALCF2SS1-6 TaxID=1328759 RepID=A0A5C2SZM5_9APHY|nr:hypothetical protein L227DRAFT_569970 [Lentinus tigrinus ALCF2SS1-6]RPD79973.1 hypothetical protein L226DRAFT_530174 [Lentinus tigrinus ALCF2SS1-7]
MAEVLYNTAGALLSYLPYIISTPTAPGPSSASSPPPPPAPPYAHHNLQHYLSTAVIPNMKLASTVPSVFETGSKSPADYLKIHHESYRELQSMQKIDDFRALVRNFSARVLPATPTDGQERYPDITVPAPGYDVLPRHEDAPNKLQTVVDWVKSFPIRTIHRIMQLVFPAMLKYDMTVEQDHDGALIQWIKWAIDADTVTESADMTRPAMTVFVQAPWIVSKKDLEAFVTTSVFPKKSLAIVPYRDVQRRWGKVYDICSRNRSHYFVLTTYWGWVFGAFSEEYTRAWVSEVIPSQSQDPTVLQCLFYWFASALDCPKSWKIPMVSDEISWPPSTFRSVCPIRSDGQLDDKVLGALSSWP